MYWFKQFETSCFQAVPYSRDYKRKYEYLKSQLRKPVSVHSV